tara:strand:+ start:267 stop:392 length:126 start_codon:yes stop_codon:yes gene_type:complete
MSTSNGKNRDLLKSFRDVFKNYRKVEATMKNRNKLIKDTLK